MEEKKLKKIIDKKKRQEDLKKDEVNINNFSLKNIYDQYIIDNNPFKLYLNNQMIYDSKVSIEKPVFYDEYFYIYNNKFSYKGIRIEKY